jgi:hypothetical protein
MCPLQPLRIEALGVVFTLGESMNPVATNPESLLCVGLQTSAQDLQV